VQVTYCAAKLLGDQPAVGARIGQTLDMSTVCDSEEAEAMSGLRSVRPM
jgi:hypothetical protein